MQDVDRRRYFGQNGFSVKVDELPDSIMKTMVDAATRIAHSRNWYAQAQRMKQAFRLDAPVQLYGDGSKVTIDARLYEFARKELKMNVYNTIKATSRNGENKIEFQLLVPPPNSRERVYTRQEVLDWFRMFTAFRWFSLNPYRFTRDNSQLVGMPKYLQVLNSMTDAPPLTDMPSKHLPKAPGAEYLVQVRDWFEFKDYSNYQVYSPWKSALNRWVSWSILHNDGLTHLALPDDTPITLPPTIEDVRHMCLHGVKVTGPPIGKEIRAFEPKGKVGPMWLQHMLFPMVDNITCQQNLVNLVFCGEKGSGKSILMAHLKSVYSNNIVGFVDSDDFSKALNHLLEKYPKQSGETWLEYFLRDKDRAPLWDETYHISYETKSLFDVINEEMDGREFSDVYYAAINMPNNGYRNFIDGQTVFTRKIAESLGFYPTMVIFCHTNQEQRLVNGSCVYFAIDPIFNPTNNLGVRKLSDKGYRLARFYANRIQKIRLIDSARIIFLMAMLTAKPRYLPRTPSTPKLPESLP